jgi:hypothetical protein
VAIADPACVAKTYPRFWDDLAGAGLHSRAGAPRRSSAREAPR